MSISEARRQLENAHASTNIVGDILSPTENAILVQRICEVIAHSANAIVEAIAENKPYDGTLNSIRIPVTTLRLVAIDLVKIGEDDIGLEDLIIALRARTRNSGVDNED